MASQAAERAPANAQPTYYFAYGSNLHLRQMKRRCPDSKYIGLARLANYRWQINERGYANVLEAEGQWVDGLVYEINAVDEAKLDISEGVSKDAYTKSRMKVDLYRAPGVLYRRPTSWIVDKGGPGKLGPPFKAGPADNSSHWTQEVLVYNSTKHVQDSSPKTEYVNRIRLGIADARLLGMDNDYITNCIQPYIPATTQGGSQGRQGPPPQASERPKTPLRGQKGNYPTRTGEGSPARRGQVAVRSDKQTLKQNPATRIKSEGRAATRPTPPPPLPPRPGPRRPRDSVIVVEEVHYVSRRG